LSTLEPWQGAILGLVEGVTEYLPVSSTGHLIIASSMLGLAGSADAKRNMDAFMIVIQGGAILAVVGLYWPRIVQMIRGILGRNRVGLRLAINIAIAFIPAAVLGILLKDWIEQHLFHPEPVLAALALGGLAMIAIGRWQRKFFQGDERNDPADAHSFVDLEHLTWRRALLIGLLQCLALWPGTSRSLATIVGGMLVGLRPRQAAEFSFLLGLPTLGGACLYSAAKNFSGDGPDMLETIGIVPIVIGVLTATISAAIAVKWLVAFLARHGLVLFGWDRLALCAVIGIMLWRGMITIAPH
jgi:undecaprenyl-diphosphatase